jgi:SAM-dependent MidA family methyltransferase
MPVHVVHWTAQGILERGVNRAFEWEDRPARGPLLEAARDIEVPAPYVSEINLQGAAWMRHLVERIEQGAIFVVDYGFPRREYYHPQRAAGTLMCHFQHRAHADPFARPGEEDISAHVDFSALAQAASGAGAEILGYTTLAHFLVNCGITEVLAQTDAQDALAYAPIAAQAQKLLSPAEMGELFKVLAVGRGVKSPLLGFTQGDRSHTL